MKNSHAYELGVDAYLNGDEFNNHPEYLTDVEIIEWRDGWIDAFAVHNQDFAWGHDSSSM